MGEIFFADTLSEHNPFSKNGEYGVDWVSASIRESAYISVENNFLYGCSIGRKVDLWEYRIMDYIRYNMMYGRNVIFIGGKRLYKKALKKYDGHSIYDRTLRPYEETLCSPQYNQRKLC